MQKCKSLIGMLNLHKQLFHISQHRAQGDQQKLWELGQQQAMVHPRNCSSSNIRFIGLFYSCLAGKLGRDLVAAAGCCCTLDRTHIQPRPGHRFNLKAMWCLYSEVLYWWFLSQPIQLKPDNKNWIRSGTMDTKWRHKSKILSEKLGRCGRQNMLRPNSLGLWLNFRPCSESNFLSGRP